jgi:hypothetical protein
MDPIDILIIRDQQIVAKERVYITLRRAVAIHFCRSGIISSETTLTPSWTHEPTVAQQNAGTRPRLIEPPNIYYLICQIIATDREN